MSKGEKPVCGIIMPISESDEFHTEAHWSGVKSMLTRAIELAECLPRPVWEKGGNDIIQASILKNLFENEIAVVDISTRNPNVMLEWGMRLTTKKPTIVVAEEGTNLPFDTGIIHTEFYDPSQQWASAEAFIETVAESIRSTLILKAAGNYKPYLESFQFETVEPSTVSVTAEERMESLFGEMAKRLTRIEGRLPVNTSHYATEGAETAFSSWLNGEHSKPTPGSPSAAFTAGLLRSIDAAQPPHNFSVGDKVVHEKFGEGTVIGIDGHKIEIDFPSHGRRRVLSAFVNEVA